MIPSPARLAVDCRVPPGLGEEAAFGGSLQEIVGRPAAYRLEWTEQVMGQPLADRLAADGLHSRLDRRAPTPARDVRADGPAGLHRLAHGSATRSRSAPPTASSRMRHATQFETDQLIHSADERIDVRDLGSRPASSRDLARGMLGTAA